VLAPELGSTAPRKPAEPRRWLRQRVPKEQLLRLAPRQRRPARIDILEFRERVRYLIRAWWLWLAAAVVLGQWSWPLALLASAASFVFYHTAPRFHPAVYAVEPDFTTDSQEFLVTMAGMTGMPLIHGNRVMIHNNGDQFYPAMLEAIESARHSVTMEQYILWDGRVGRRFAEAFAEKARQGIPVKLLIDAVGSSSAGEEILRILEAGGCQLAWYRPVHWYTLDRINSRTHRKSLIVDGQIAFTGGAGLADHWLGNAGNEYEWRDTQISVQGPAAQVQQAGFAQNWLLTTGEMLSGHDFFPVPEPAGDVQTLTILSSPSSGAAAAGTMYLLAVQCARRFIYIANPYFIPHSGVIRILGEACKRGVEVKLMVAGRHNDVWWARQNSVRLYGKLLNAGVEIYEFAPTMLHQKTMIVDGVWATVGTANFDNRSFTLNEETQVCFHDPHLVESMRRIFLTDLARCEPVDLAVWKRRGLWQRSLETLASLVQDQM
jgi:cardiolipin synthase